MRHRILPGLILWTFLLGLVLVAAESAPRYNVLYLVVDDLRPEFLASYGQSQMVTPNVDKLAQSGLTFNRAYCQYSVCCPTRNSFLTGRRPHHTNVLDQHGNFRDLGKVGAPLSLSLLTETQ